MMWESWWMNPLESPVLITVEKGVRWHVLLCMCFHLLLRPVCLMSVRWAYMPLFYHLCSHSVHWHLICTWGESCLHVPNCYGCVFWRFIWTSLVSCLVGVAWLHAWLPCTFRTWYFVWVVDAYSRFLVCIASIVCFVDDCGKGSCMTCFALHVSPFATPTFFLDERKMGIHASFL